MIYKVNRLTYGESLLTAVMVGLCGMAQIVAAAEVESGESQNGLNLFISTPQQLRLEKEQRSGNSEQQGVDELPVTGIDKGYVSDDMATHSLAPQKAIAEDLGIGPRRYDGVVFRGDQILSVWFDGNRYNATPGSPGFQIEFIDRSGRIELSVSNGSYELVPGDVLSQKHVALLVAMMAMLAGSALFLANGYKTDARNQTLDSLLSAKQALIGYAVNYADNYGHNTRGGTGRLPCPSLTRHSTPARSCGSGAIGYLPSVWMRSGRLMEIDYLERFLNQDIWYAVSADHRYNPSFNTLNSYRRDNLLTVDSNRDIVAVLVAPGQPLDSQNRDSVGSLPPASVVAEYLEGENADADNEFTVTGNNDLLVTITRDELLPLMERRVLGHAKEWLSEYKAKNGFYPYASTPGGGGQCVHSLTRGMLATEGACGGISFADEVYTNIPQGRSLRQTWFYRYNWPALIYYIVDESCTADRGATDCDGVDDPERRLTVDGKPVEVVLISVGPPITTFPAGGLQIHGTAEIANYLDTETLINAGTTYETPTLSTVSNDQLVFIN